MNHDYSFLRRFEPVYAHERNLPHWRQAGVTYFVTFRTADSLPQTKVRLWAERRAQWIERHPEPLDDAARQEYAELFPIQIQRWLDNGYGACTLDDPELRAIVEESLCYHDRKRYLLHQYVVAANHVHALVTPLPGYPLSKVVGAWKSFSAKRINERIGKRGVFWQQDSHDHIVRSPEDVSRICEYICGHREAER